MRRVLTELSRRDREGREGKWDLGKVKRVHDGFGPT